MPIFITQGKYTAQALKGLVAKPEDRLQEVKGLIERAGGKLLGYYVTFGEYDWMIVAENADPVAVMAGAAIGGATGTVSDMKTTLALTSAEAKRAFEMAHETASQFRPAGT